MRILFVVHAYPPDIIGGHEIRCQRTAEGLRQRGHEVLILTGYRNRPSIEGHVWRLLSADLGNNVELRYMLAWELIYRRNFSIYIDTIQKFKPDVVLLWHSYRCTNIFVKQIISSNMVPVIMFIGAPQPLLPDRWERFWSSLGSNTFRRIIKSFLRFIITLRLPDINNIFTPGIACFNSYFLRNWALGFPYFHCEKTVVIHGGVDIRLFTPRSPKEYNYPPQIAYVGRIDPSRNIEILLKALYKIKNKIRLSLKGYIYGPVSEPKLKEKLKEMIKSMELSDQIILNFTGLNPYEIPQFLKSIDIFVYPSICDWFPNSILEAMASGCAVITTDVGGQLEVIKHKVNGIIVPINDEDTLVEALIELIIYPNKIVSLGQCAQETITRYFTFEHYLDKIEKLLQEVAGR
jgi:glycosyltransferase involved in cell wall biosynthesis